MGTAASAAVTANKSFTPTSITATGTSVLTVTLTNVNASPATGAAVTDSLPAGLVVATPANASTTCGGTATATAGGGSVSLAGGTIPASGNCTVSVGVTSATPGAYINTIPAGAVASSLGSNSSAATATLTVVPVNPVSVSANPSNFYLIGGVPATLTVTLTNPNLFPLTNVAVPMNLPDVVGIANPSNFSTTCSGGTVSGASGTHTVTLSGATMPTNSSCTVTFDLMLPLSPLMTGTGHLFTVAAGTLTSTEGVSNLAYTGSWSEFSYVNIGKSFNPTKIANGGISTLTVGFTNYEGVVATLDWTDNLPAGLTVAAAPNITNTCGGTITALPGASSISIASGSLAASTNGVNSQTFASGPSCTFSVDVIGTNSGTSALVLKNAVPAGSFPVGGIPYTDANATLSIYPPGPLQIDKTIGDAATTNVYCGGSTHISYIGSSCAITLTIVNSSGAPETGIGLTDDLTTMGPGFTVTDLTPSTGLPTSPPTTTCGGTLSAPIGGTLVTLTGGSLPVAGTCTVTFYFLVGSAATTSFSGAAGLHINTIPVGGVVSSLGPSVAAASDLTYTLPYNVQIYKSLPQGAPSTYTAGATFPYQVAVYNLASASSMANVAFSDTLPPPLVLAANPNPMVLPGKGGCGTPTFTATPGATSFSVSNITLGVFNNTFISAGSSACFIQVDVTAPGGTTPGTYTNSLSPTSVSGNLINPSPSIIPTSFFVTGNGLDFTTPVTASVNIVNTKVSVAKGFSPVTIALGGTSTMTLTLINNDPQAIALTNAALTDALPTGMTVASPANAALSGAGCSGGTLTATTGASSVSVSGMSVALNAVCTITVDVTSASTAGNLNNTIPAGAVTSDQFVTNPAKVVATLAVLGTADLAITKTDNLAGAALSPGGTVVYTLTASNNGPASAAGVAVVDTPPSGLTITGWTCVTAGANSSCGNASGSGPINETATVGVSETVVYTVTATLSAPYTGTSVTNTASITPPGSLVDPVLTNNTASDTVPVNPSLSLNMTWAANSNAGDAANVTTTGGAQNASVSSVATAAGNTTNGSAAYPHAGDVITFPAETFTSGSASNYTTTLSCTGNTNALSSTTLPATLTISASDVNVVCTYTNTRITGTLTLAKAWSNGIAGNTANIGATTGLTNNTSASNYTTTLSCTGNTNALSSTTAPATLTIDASDVSVVCTYTNVRKSATLTLAKTWAAGSVAGDTVTVTSAGFTNTATSGSSVATAAGNTTTGTAVTVYAGESGTIGEAFSVGSASNYTSALSCTGNATALTGNTLTISPTDTAIVCTETNARSADMQASAPANVAGTVGIPVSVTTTCTNAGPNPAANATCVVSFPGGTPAGTTTTCSTPANPLAVGGTITCTTVFTPIAPGTVQLLTTAGSTTLDPNPSNNTATTSIVTPVPRPPAPAPLNSIWMLALLALTLVGAGFTAVRRSGT
jgi:uncharacterized repeat protein (TIGR01451 family)